jgi:hypothetical protein
VQADLERKVEIFMRLPDGHAIWIRAVENLEEATLLLNQFAASAPGEDFIFEGRNGQVSAA